MGSGMLTYDHNRHRIFVRAAETGSNSEDLINRKQMR